MCPSEMLVNLKKSRTYIQVTNKSERSKHFVQNRPVAYFDVNDVAHATQGVCKELFNHLHNSECSNVSSKVSSQQTLRRRNQEKYPHLDPHDPLLDMTEEEVFCNHVNLSDSVLNSRERSEFLDMLMRHREAFSLYGELSTCTGHEIDFQLENDEPFFIRPYFTTESDKVIIEKEMDKLVTLGILGVGHSSYTSPVLIVPKKGTNEKRVVTDFRYLNSRIKRINHPFPLLSRNHEAYRKFKCKSFECNGPEVCIFFRYL